MTGSVGSMAKAKREKKPEPPKEPELYVLPTRLRIGNRIGDESGEREVLAGPYTTGGGKIVNARVQRAGSDAVMIRVWGAHERVCGDTNRRRVMTKTALLTLVLCSAGAFTGYMLASGARTATAVFDTKSLWLRQGRDGR